MAKKAGKDFKLYISTTALTASTNAEVDGHTGWNEVAAVQDVANNSERTEVAFKTRENGGESQYFAGTFDESIEFTLAYDTGDSRYTELQAAYIAGSEVAVADVDGAVNTAGTKGWAGNCKILAFNRQEGIDDPVTVDVRFRPSSFIKRDYASEAV